MPAGIPDAEITTTIDTRAVLDRKRAALQAHASQLADTVWVQVDEAEFAELFGQETFMRVRDRDRRRPAGDGPVRRRLTSPEMLVGVIGAGPPPDPPRRPLPGGRGPAGLTSIDGVEFDRRGDDVDEGVGPQGRERQRLPDGVGQHESLKGLSAAHGQIRRR